MLTGQTLQVLSEIHTKSGYTACVAYECIITHQPHEPNLNKAYKIEERGKLTCLICGQTTEKQQISETRYGFWRDEMTASRFFTTLVGHVHQTEPCACGHVHYPDWILPFIVRTENGKTVIDTVYEVETSVVESLTEEGFNLFPNFPAAVKLRVQANGYEASGYQVCRYLSRISLDPKTQEPVESSAELTRVYARVLGQAGKAKRLVNGTLEPSAASSAFVDLKARFAYLRYEPQSGQNAMNRSGLRNYLDYVLIQNPISKYSIPGFLSQIDVYEQLRSVRPGVEQLSKCGYLPLIHNLINSNGLKGKYNRLDAEQLLSSGSNPSSILGYEKAVLKRLKELGVFNQPLSELRAFQSLHAAVPVTIQALSKLTPMVTIRSLTDIGNAKTIIELVTTFGYTLVELIDYLERAWLGQVLKPDVTLHYLKDYRHLCTLLEVEPERFPRHLQLSHDLMARNVKYKEDEQVSKQFIENTTAYHYLEYAPKNEKFFMKLPTSPHELIQEGEALAHCVASYVQRVASGQTVILFLRQTVCPEIPYITVEWRDGGVGQVSGVRNARLENYPEAEKFFKKWLKQLPKAEEKAVS